MYTSTLSIIKNKGPASLLHGYIWISICVSVSVRNVILVRSLPFTYITFSPGEKS